VIKLIKQLDPESERVLSLIPKGRQNALSKRELMILSGIEKERLFRMIIFNLRMSDIPILSAVQPPYGFYFAAEESETREALQQMHNRTMKLHTVDRHIRCGLRQQFPDSQLPLDLPDTA
jgi:hypothetical protein